MKRHPLRTYRLQAAMTQQETAKKLGVSSALVSRIETNDRVVSTKMAVAIEKKLGIPKAILRPDIWD